MAKTRQRVHGPISAAVGLQEVATTSVEGAPRERPPSPSSAVDFDRTLALVGA